MPKADSKPCFVSIVLGGATPEEGEKEGLRIYWGCPNLYTCIEDKDVDWLIHSVVQLFAAVFDRIEVTQI